jgi:hypothetical protein
MTHLERTVAEMTDEQLADALSTLAHETDMRLQADTFDGECMREASRRLLEER